MEVKRLINEEPPCKRELSFKFMLNNGYVMVNESGEETRRKADGKCGEVRMERDDQVMTHVRVTGSAMINHIVIHHNSQIKPAINNLEQLSAVYRFTTKQLEKKEAIEENRSKNPFRNMTPISSSSGDVSQNDNTIKKTDKTFICDVCRYSTNRSSNLTTHKRKHTGERPYICQVCSKGFRDSGELNTHLRIHTGERPYKCNYCGKAFSQGGALKRHKLIHTGEKPWQCRLCGHRCRENGSLTKHLRVHTGERPYVCRFPDCHKAFTTSGGLARHKRIHGSTKSDADYSYSEKTETLKNNDFATCFV